MRSSHFHQIRNDGRNFSENLDLIKEDLRREIRDHRGRHADIIASLGSENPVLRIGGGIGNSLHRFRQPHPGINLRGNARLPCPP